MNIFFDEKQLVQLMSNLRILTGMRANILDPLRTGYPPVHRSPALLLGNQRSAGGPRTLCGLRHAEGEELLRGKGLPVLPLCSSAVSWTTPPLRSSGPTRNACWTGILEASTICTMIPPIPPLLLAGAAGLRRDPGSPFRLHTALFIPISSCSPRRRKRTRKCTPPT